MPKISVIVPVYKVEPYLRRCVDSILKQTFNNFELILVDDGSPDGCPAICDEYAKKDSRVIVIHQQNGGLSAARNAGIDWSFTNSDSEWIYFADSDDWIHTKSLEALFRGAKETGLDVVIGGYEYTQGENPKVDLDNLSVKKWNTETYFCEHNVNAVVAWGKLYKKECFKNIRYPVGKIHEDEFTTYKILFEYQEVAVIDQPLYAYFQNSNGIMGTKWNPKRLAAADALEERADYFLKRNNHRMYLHSLKMLLTNLAYQIHLAEESKVDEKTQIEIRNLLKKKIRKYHKLIPVQGNEYCYSMAYPHLMGIYWRIDNIKKGFKF